MDKHPADDGQGSGSLVVFARVLTDRTYLALVLDVIVAPEHRCAGG